MAVKHAQVTVGSTATNLLTIPDMEGYRDVARSVILQNNSAQDIFIGGPTVTTTSFGYKLRANGGELSWDLALSDIPHGVATGSPVLNITHSGV